MAGVYAVGVAGGGVARGGGVVKREAGGAGDRLQKFKALNTKFLTGSDTPPGRAR